MSYHHNRRCMLSTVITRRMADRQSILNRKDMFPKQRARIAKRIECEVAHLQYEVQQCEEASHG